MEVHKCVWTVESRMGASAVGVVEVPSTSLSLGHPTPFLHLLFKVWFDFQSSFYP